MDQIDKAQLGSDKLLTPDNVKYAVLTDIGEELMTALLKSHYTIRVVRTRAEMCKKYEAIHNDEIKLSIVEYPTVSESGTLAALTPIRSHSGGPLRFAKGIHINIKVKGPRGTWIATDHFVRSSVEIEKPIDAGRYYYTVDKFITELLALEPPRESINHVKLLCPHDFNKPSIQSVGDTINLVHFYQNVRVIGFGRILEDLRVSTEVESPDSDCWFILEGHTIWNGADATARMLVKQDGDKLVFVPVMTFTTKMHICDMTTKGKRIDYNGCTAIDGEIVREAITHYLSKM